MEFLIARGHRFEDLWKSYTMDQVMLFYSAADENRRQEILDLSVSVRAAFGADKREWTKYVGVLKQKRIKSGAPEQISPQEKFRAFKEMLSGK